MGPLTGVFDHRAAEHLNHRPTTVGFDAISAEESFLAHGVHVPRYPRKEEAGVTGVVFSPKDFRVETDSMTNARLGVELLDSMIARRGVLDLSEGARKLARRLARDKGKELLDSFVYLGYARKGWIVPNQYWTPGVLSPVAIMGKYYMHYGRSFCRRASLAAGTRAASFASSPWTTSASAASTGCGRRR